MLKARYEFDEETEPRRFFVTDHWRAAFLFHMMSPTSQSDWDSVIVVVDEETLEESYFHVNPKTRHPNTQPFHTNPGVGKAI